MRLVFATRRPPWPLDSGARIRAFRLAEGLARRFELTLVTFADGPAQDSSTASREELERALPHARLEFVNYGRRPPGGARRGALRPGSDTFAHYATPSLRDALGRLVATPSDAILHLDDPGVALAGLGLPARLTVAATHNVEHRIIRDIARRMPLAHRPFMALEAAKIEREERRIWRGADLTVAVSQLDAATISAAGAQRVEVCPNGSDAHEPLPQVPLAPGEPLRLLFVASLRFWPYAYALSWFIREALPLMREAAGPVELAVVGDHDGDVVREDGVVYHGRVPEVEPFYAHCHALALPVFEGSGTRLKVIEAAHYGRTVLSTPLGVEGLPIGEHFLRAEDAPAFAAAAVRLREELEAGGSACAARCARAREALAHLTWPRIAAHLADTYEDALRA